MSHFASQWALSLSVLALLAGCGGGDVEPNPPPPQEQPSNEYLGPAPSTPDIQKYKVSLWDNIASQDKCGSCHTEGAQAPYFASNEDVNDAYAATLPLVDLTNPAASRLVDKVAGGHNCWLSSDSACGETMAQWIKLWSDERVSAVTTIELTAPILREPGASKNYPADTTLFSQQLYPLLNQYCAQCHNEGADTPQSPFFASNDIDLAYDAATKVFNIDEPSQSRLVVRLGSEFHNCWSNCQDNSAEMLAAIQAFSDAIDVDAISPEMVVSKGLRLTDGITASSGGRYESDLIALYQFKAGEGSVAFDTSGISPAANLNLSGEVKWLGSWGLAFNNGKAQASTASSKKLHDLIRATNEFTVEAWVTPSNVTQEGPARIVTYSAGDNDRNFTLGQTQYNYDFLLRTEATNGNGDPALSTPDADEVLQATLQHVVLSYNAVEGRKIYVNGQLIEVADDDIAPLAGWDDSFALILGREASNQHVWQGDIRLLAIYNRQLTAEQIQQNYEVGVGEKFYLLFSISHLMDLPNTYVMFEVSQFDNYSYLFSQASLVNIDGSAVSEGFEIKGMRLGINGKESAQGQAYANLESLIGTGQALAEPLSLSTLGTIIGLEKGASNDEFFLTFEQLGEHTNVRVPGVFITPEAMPANSETAHIGVRNFAEINHSMSVLTGVAQSAPKPAATYQLVQRQLPSIDNIDTFISAQQMGITQLAIAYCDAAVEDPLIRSRWLPQVDFSQAPAQALSPANRPLLLVPLLDQLMPLALTSQPQRQLISTELDGLIERLSVCGSNCNAERTRTIAKSSCAAVLASAVMLVQ
ncbi:LamG domain-containing protein [uncultured Ferrimonas sp.]|uniref:LamG domain-containing protein n=1 Tax=uncultured Ferrimonas sp. TaxID=432640 RepID=UPI00261E90B2|nr:LamG domain-containing protein [uncultured Ferrimonas sp.]